MVKAAAMLKLRRCPNWGWNGSEDWAKSCCALVSAVEDATVTEEVD
jgi:hypothetical protein